MFAITSPMMPPPCVCYEALECAKLCRDAYYAPRHVILKKTSPDTLIVANAGTDNIYDWFANLSFKKHRRGEHSGFYYKAQWSIRRNAIREKVAQPSVHNVVFCGHSSGGAAAMMMSTILRKELRPKARVSVYMFGSPKLGNHAFADFVDDIVRERDDSLRVYNIRNGRDPVSTIPFFADYVHATPPIGMVSTVEEAPLDNHYTSSYIRSLTDCIRDARSLQPEGRCLSAITGRPCHECRHTSYTTDGEAKYGAVSMDGESLDLGGADPTARSRSRDVQ